MTHPLDVLRYHVTGAIERGEGEAITGVPATSTILALLQNLEDSADTTGCTDDLIVVSRSALEQLATAIHLRAEYDRQNNKG